MPSFVCDFCQETLKKAKLDQHASRCRKASFSCIDCYKTFKGVEYREHVSCITEVQKYHGKKSESAKRVLEDKAGRDEKKCKAQGDKLIEMLSSSLLKPTSFRDLKRTLKEGKMKNEFESRCIVSFSNNEFKMTFN